MDVFLIHRELNRQLPAGRAAVRLYQPDSFYLSA